MKYRLFVTQFLSSIFNWYLSLTTINELVTGLMNDLLAAIVGLVRVQVIGETTITWTLMDAP